MRILIAEDDPVIALGLAERLRELGHQAVGPARDGEQASLIEALGISEPEAFRRIQRLARDRNKRLVEVAREIVDQRDVLVGRRADAEPDPHR